ncbi:MAG: flagellar hook capping FlgD N-terminal domain-containing protein [Acidobacteriaceae bacterium]
MQIANPPDVTLPFQSPTALASGVQTDATSPSSTSSSNPGTSAATITANDFLQLLVTELQNQDPTANTDPNEYVDQLVQVNSLQQQIQMNQTLDGGPTLTGASNGVLQELTQMNQAIDGDLSSTGASAQVSQSATPDAVSAQSPAAVSVGNLSASAGGKTTAAEAVATALAHSPNHADAGGQAGAFAQFAAGLRAQTK